MRMLVAGFLMLAVGAFLDTMRGPLLPLLQSSLGFSHTAGGLFLVTASVASISVTLVLNGLFERFGERRVAHGALAAGVLAAVSGFGVTSYPTALGLGLLLGAAAASLGALSNVFVIRGSTAASLGRNLCGLHAMYGAGSALAPAVLGAALSRGVGWPWALAILPAGLAALAVLAIPASGVAEAEAEARSERARLGGLEVLILLTITAYVVGEVLCSLWMTSFLVETTGATPASAAPVLSAFFGAMFVVRLLAFAGLRARWEWPVLWGSLVIGITGQALGIAGFSWGLALAGAMGLYFPVFFARVSRLFPRRWRALAVWMLAATQLGLAAMNLVMGQVADRLGLQQAYWLPLCALLLCAVCTAVYASIERRVSAA